MNEPQSVVYDAPPTIARFFASDAFCRGIIGPLGSGKSSGCTLELLRRASTQAPAPDGIRHTRFVVIRNSYRELADTTRRTVEDWIPAAISSWSEGNASMMVRFNDVECEILFRALDTPADVKKLLSLEITGAWINEGKEIGRAVFDMLQGRVGRYPSKRMGGPTWCGIWMDTNPPDEDHWIYKVFEEMRPPGHEIFHQPSGLSDDAENLQNLPGGRAYYERLVHGKAPEWINVYVHGRYGFVRDGKPVYPEYRDELHSLQVQPAPPPAGATLILGMDFGLTPAIVVFHKTPSHQWQAIDEFVSEDMGATRFAAHVATELKRKHPYNLFRGWGDPAGTQRSQVDERTPYEVVQAAGIPIDPCHTNDFVLRRDSVAFPLLRLTMSGVPSFVVTPACPKLRKAMAGGYCFRRVQISGDERYRDAPDKNMHSHVAEAAQYALLGEGEDRRALDQGDYHTNGLTRAVKVHTSIKIRGHR